jgi:4-hydroxy-tetrahydrodipicolinate synthase/2-dehydro-3-deoxy-phosphogluconate/2-dehydro-3-deoxy-6-phosphogalactonate aldolase
MSNKERFFGVNVVVPIPLLEDENLDKAGLAHLIDFYIESGCHGLTIPGSGGEFPYFTFEEKLEIVRTAADAVRGRVPILVVGGFYSRAEILRFIRESGALAFDAFLILVPTYFSIGFGAVYELFRAICHESTKPVFYYHYPQHSQVYLAPEQVARILAIDGMAGMKDSILSVPEISRHLSLIREQDVSLFAGNSLVLLRVLERGASGVIGILPSLFPSLVVDCFNAWQKGDRQTASQLQTRLLDCIPFMNSFGPPGWLQKTAFRVLSRLPFTPKGRNPSRHAVFKETLRQMGHPISARVRSPLPQIQDDEREAIQDFLAKHAEGNARRS